MKEVYNEKLNDYVVCASNPPWVVQDVSPQKDYSLILTFVNGERKKYNALPLLDKAIYAPLKNLAFFMSAKVGGDSVVWNDEIDISPEHLYEHSQPLANSWDSDFTKLTPVERKKLDESIKDYDNGETVSHDSIDWN